MRKSVSLAAVLLDVAIAASPVISQTAPAGSDIEKKFDAAINNAEMGGWMKRMAAEPNHVGSPHNKLNAEYTLQRFKDLPPDTLVLPSHGRPFRGIGARVDELVRHHDERCAALRAACHEPRSAGELLSTLFPRELDTHQVMFAMGEAIAHLNHLAVRREVRQVSGSDGIVRYQTYN